MGPSDAGEVPVDAGVVIAPTQACERLAIAECALKKRCYAAFVREPDMVCAQNEQARCLANFAKLQGSYDRGTVRVDEARLTACEKRMASSACPPSFPPDHPAAVARPFADCTLETGVLVGSVPAGETCVAAQECAEGTVCIKPSGVCRGICSTAPKLGQPCAFGCATGFICARGGTCAARQPLDGPCETSPECETDLICFEGLCRPRRKLGDVCSFDPTVPSTCEPGLACDVVPFVRGVTGRCIQPRGLDDTCTFHWGCAPGLVCADINWSGFPTTAPSRGSCRAPDEAQAPCRGSIYGQFIGEQCQAGTACDLMTQVCTPAPTRGQPCTPSRNTCAGVDTYCKPSGSGDVGTCTGPAALNEPCAFAIDSTTTVSIPCAAGYCDRVNSLTCRPSTKPLNAMCSEDAECLSGRCAVQPDSTLRCTEAC